MIYIRLFKIAVEKKIICLRQKILIFRLSSEEPNIFLYDPVDPVNPV